MDASFGSVLEPHLKTNRWELSFSTVADYLPEFRDIPIIHRHLPGMMYLLLRSGNHVSNPNGSGPTKRFVFARFSLPIRQQQRWPGLPHRIET
jgi:hypothetical protein